MVRPARILFALLALGAAGAASAAGSGYPLQKAHTDVGSLESLQRGARNFVNYCLGCHSAQYMRYSQLADDLALTEDELRESLMFTGTRVYDPMLSSMPGEQARLWFGNAPPDLSLIVRSRGRDYVYTFLKSFYADPAKATGVNNTVLPGTAMPHVLWELQGTQEAVWEGHTDAQGNVQKHFKEFTLANPGKLTPEQYDEFVRDTVNFLEYIGEPIQAKRQSMGFVVIAFLVFFTLLAYALKKEYWKDVR